MTVAGLCPPDLTDVLTALGLDVVDVVAEALPGGVSSDIWLVRTPTRTVVAKRALAQLRVAAEWHAPVERSTSEANWLRFAADAVPGCCPRLLHHDPGSGWLVMEHLDPASHRLWKSELLAGVVDGSVAEVLGERLGRLHAFGAGDPGLAEVFATDDLFDALRIDPYLRSLLPVHPDVAERLATLIEVTRSTRRTVVHGDVSPKNILVGPAGPVVLDAETAWWGDPAFDVAFLLTHLTAKAVHRPDRAGELVGAAERLLAAYAAQVTWEPAADVLSRAAALLPAVALARVDGKSPLEYLDEPARDTLRTRALSLLRDPGLPMPEVIATLSGTRT